MEAPLPVFLPPPPAVSSFLPPIITERAAKRTVERMNPTATVVLRSGPRQCCMPNFGSAGARRAITCNTTGCDEHPATISIRMGWRAFRLLADKPPPTTGGRWRRRRSDRTHCDHASESDLRPDDTATSFSSLPSTRKPAGQHPTPSSDMMRAASRDLGSATYEGAAHSGNRRHPARPSLALNPQLCDGTLACDMDGKGGDMPCQCE